MIPKNVDLLANADRRAIARALAKVVKRPAAKVGKPPKGTPQHIVGLGNYLVKNVPGGAASGPTQAGMQYSRGQRAAMVAQDGLLPVPGLDQRSVLYKKKGV